jgi:hypothetical protein
MQARTVGRATALLVASVVLVAVTFIVATWTAADTTSAETSNAAAQIVGGATLKEYFLPTLQWNDVEVTPADPASGDMTLKEYFLLKLIWRSAEVTMEDAVNEDFDGGSFTATGSAICDSGETNTLDWHVTETLWWYESEFTCADGSGTFVVRAELPPPPDPDTEAASEPLDGTWTIESGTGEYSNLEGSGTLSTNPDPAIASYSGKMTYG